MLMVTDRMKRLTVALCALALGGCVGDTEVPVLKAAPGASAQVALAEFVTTLATVDFIDDKCRSTGLRKVYRSKDALISNYARSLQAQGYSQREILDAMDDLSVDAIATKGFQRMEAKGVRRNDVASVCRMGRAEIEAGSAIGKLMRDEA